MIVGTAGHIDHGKTTLVKALTGVDTDRLPEEKQRGISIELGYAFLAMPDCDQCIGFVDVPGHERLVQTMVAGATGIDFALLVVAADDGVMPQTREHFAVLSLLGLARGAVVVTKIDRVDDARVRAVCADATALTYGTSLARAPVLTVSARRGDGLPELREQLFAAARATRRDVGEGAAFRLAVDRAFTLDGVGTVATGTVHGGTVAVGEELCVVPGEARARVRSVHAQNRPVTQAHSGQRCAVALAGITRDAVPRGRWLVAPAAVQATARVDVSLTVWHAEPGALRSGTPVHLHIGAAAVFGKLALLDADLLSPGASGRAQLVLHTPVGAWHGDRVVLRDASASRTIAGGRVLDPCAPARYRRTWQRLAELDALAQPAVDARLAALLAVAPHGIDLRRFAAAQAQSIGALPEGTLHWRDTHGDWALGAAQTKKACAAVLGALKTFHEGVPDELGPDAGRLRRLALPRLPEPLWHSLLADLRQRGAVALRGAVVHLPEHGVRLSANDERIAQKVAPLLSASNMEGYWARDLARDTGEPEPSLRSVLMRLAGRGELHQVVRDLFYPPAAMARLAAVARRVAAEHEGVVTAAHFRDATQLGRKRAIQVLEHFDRIGLVRRAGDLRRLRTDSTLFQDDTDGT